MQPVITLANSSVNRLGGGGGEDIVLAVPRLGLYPGLLSAHLRQGGCVQAEVQLLLLHLLLANFCTQGAYVI